MKTALKNNRTPAQVIANQIKILMDARAAIDKAIENTPQFLTDVSWADVAILAKMVNNVKRADLVE